VAIFVVMKDNKSEGNIKNGWPKNSFLSVQSNYCRH